MIYYISFIHCILVASVIYISYIAFLLSCISNFCYVLPVHCKNCGVLCPPNEQHTIGVISHQPLKVCLAHLIWCARS